METDIKELLEDAVRETGTDLGVNAGELAALTSKMAVVLAASVGQPGYAQAAVAARDIIALQGGIVALKQHEALRERIMGIIVTALTFGSKALAGALLGTGGTLADVEINPS